MDELIGTEVGSYRLIRVLGEGGMGRVYIGEQAEIAARVAIKVLTTKDPDLVARFFAEARAVNVIKHPGLVKVLALSHLSDGRPYIIMELVEGETLRTLVTRDSPLPIGGVLDVMKQLLAALGAAHARGVVHRDLKPDNVMVTLDGTVKVLDFGIAKLSTTLGGGNMTQVGAQIGTPAYMAPEQIRGDEVDARTDVYAAGVLLYEAITGRHPFEALSEYELLKGHLETPPPRLAARRRDAPAVLEPIVEKALAKKPAARYASTKELSAALDAAGIGTQKLIARIPVTGPRTFVPNSNAPETVRERRPSAPNVDVRPTVDHKRPSQQPVAPTRVESARKMPANRVWLAGTLLVIAGGAVVVAGWPRDAPTKVVATTPAADAAAPVAVADAASVTAPPDARMDLARLADRSLRIDVAIDPRHFDPIANIAKAQLAARRTVSNVVLTGFRVDSAHADGTLDFDDSHVVAYYFAIPNLPLDDKYSDSYCRVGVTVNASGWDVLSVLMRHCAGQEQRIPKCTLGAVWQRALAQRQKRDVPARIEWLDGRWLFAQAGTQIEIDDNCGKAAPMRDVAADAGVPSAPLDASVSNAYYEYDFLIDDFEPIKMIPNATRWAHKLHPDAWLSSIHLAHIDNGDVSLSNTAYQFYTSGPVAASTCTSVTVSFGSMVRVTRAEGQLCDAQKLRTPRCSVAQILGRIQPRPEKPFSMTLTARGWLVGNDIYDDDCK
ncbi:MAG TPA: serine/threonine-protein kinase [Kofleriaceae bacterium]|nr:serine/threonine-protein kinase [Kofleriaceae bacterium]